MIKNFILMSAAIFVPKTLLLSVLPQSMFMSLMLGSVVFTLFLLSSLVAGVYFIWIGLRVALYLARATFNIAVRIYTAPYRQIARSVHSLALSIAGRYTSLRFYLK